MDLLDDDSSAVLRAVLESCAQSASAGPGGRGREDHVADAAAADDIMDGAESCYDHCLLMDDSDILSQCSLRESSAASDVAPLYLDPESDSDNMPLDADPSGGDSWTPGEIVEPWITDLLEDTDLLEEGDDSVLEVEGASTPEDEGASILEEDLLRNPSGGGSLSPRERSRSARSRRAQPGSGRRNIA
jgi:hypothetical protein